MKICPNCKAELEEHARFCLHCMTSLEEKETIQPPMRHVRRWPWVLLCLLLLGGLLFFAFYKPTPPAETPAEPTGKATEATTTPSSPTEATTPVADSLTQEIDGVTYTFRPATKEDHPTAIDFDRRNHYVLIQVTGTPGSGIYQVPSFLNEDTTALVTVIADGAFSGTDARKIDLGHNVRHVWGNAFGGYPLTDLYFHTDVAIDTAAFSGCTEDLTIHCPCFLENTQGQLWSELAVEYGFHWQEEIL